MFAGRCKLVRAAFPEIRDRVADDPRAGPRKTMRRGVKPRHREIHDVDQSTKPLRIVDQIWIVYGKTLLQLRKYLRRLMRILTTED